jgi:hypothetical protein
MVTVACAHCGSRFDLHGSYDDFEGPVPCVECHRATFVSVVRGEVIVSERWPRTPRAG